MTTALHRLRLTRGQTLRELAAEVGCSYETIRRIENGRTGVHPGTRYALEQTLGLPFEVLTASMNTNGGAPKDTAVKRPVTTAKLPQVHDES